MIRRYRMFAVHLLAVLLPCAVIGLLGYKWLMLEREMEPRRSKEAAEAAAAVIRQAITDHLRQAVSEVAKKWRDRARGGMPFALPPVVPDMVESAYLFSGEGKLIYPDYEGAYRRAISDCQAASGRPEWQKALARAMAFESRGQIAQARQALEDFLPQAQQMRFPSPVLLELGRLSLQEKKYDEAESQARRILQCCAETRDEYGISYTFYAARQLVASWEAQGSLQNRFPELATQLTSLCREGRIGHPTDLPELSALAARAGNPPEAVPMLAEAGRIADCIRSQTENGKRLEKWTSGSATAGLGEARLAFRTLWNGDIPQIAALYRDTGSDVVLTLFATDPLATWINEHSAEGGRFEAFVTPAGKEGYGATLRAVLLPETPGFDLILQAREWNPAVSSRRQMLFAGVLIAALLLVMLVGYFAFRDFSREMQLAGMRSNFVAGVTHDLKTPLTAIRMLAETLQLGRTRDPAVTRHILGTIVKESERLTRLLENVLTFAKIEKGARSYRLEEIDLQATVLGAAKRFDYFLEQEGFHLVTDTDGRGLFVNADADALTQALLNLLNNAVKYSGKSREIHLSVRARGEEAEIRVVDNGIGIARSEQRRIFESFYRAPEAARETSGAGLGLALVRHFAEAHRGRITVASEPGKGSAFSLWLPLAKTERSRVVTPADSKPEDQYGENSNR